MMTIEQLRAALHSPDPTAALDDLIRAELAAGWTTGELYQALLPLVRTVRKESPLPTDVDEALLGTLDALIGHCNPDECYQDLPRTDRPTQEVAERLVAPPGAEVPRWPLPK